MEKNECIANIIDAISNGKLNTITNAVNDAIEIGFSGREVLDCMINAMDDVGDKFQNNDIYVPDMLIAAKTMERGVNALRPILSEEKSSTIGKIIIGSVSGDLHDIGKNLVIIMLKSAGFEVIDLGIDVPAEEFIKAKKANPDCNIIALSALLTFTLPSMEDTIKAIRKSNMCKNVKIMIGGAPTSAEYAEKIGADAYSKDAVEAVKVALKLLDLH